MEDARDDEAVECGPPDLEENHTPEQPEAVFSDDEGSDVEEVKPELPIGDLRIICFLVLKICRVLYLRSFYKLLIR